MSSQMRRLLLEQITIDPAIQVRVKGLDKARVEMFVEILKSGGEVDPIHVFNEGKCYWVVDGFHRIEAHLQLKLTGLYADVTRGDYNAALTFAETANLYHGLPLTNEDKKNLLWRRLGRNHEWATFSNGKLAGELGVHKTTVGEWIAEYRRVGNPTPERGKTVGKDGKAYNTDSISKSQSVAKVRANSPVVQSQVEPSLPPSPALPDHVSMKPLNKGSDAPQLDDHSAARLRVAQIRPAIREIHTQTAKLLETQHVNILNGEVSIEEREQLAAEILATIERQVRFLGELVPHLPRVTLLSMRPNFADANNLMHGMIDVYLNKIREI